MKFSDLPSLQRSFLAALASAVGSTLHTGQLAGYCGNDARRAANDLCALRDLGLVFSHQKTGGDQYAKWQISKVGMAVFEGRPDGDVVMRRATAQDGAQEEAKAPKLWQVQSAKGEVYADIATEDEAKALAFLQAQAEANAGVHLYLITTVASAFLPKPTATITRL